MEFNRNIICFILFILLRIQFSTALTSKDKKSTKLQPMPDRCIGEMTKSTDTYCSADLSIKKIESGEKAAFAKGQIKIEYELKNSIETACDATVEYKMSIPTEYGEISKECVILNSTMIRCTYGILKEDDKKLIIINLKWNNSIPTDEKYLIVEAEATNYCIDIDEHNNFDKISIRISEKNIKWFELTLIIASIILLIIIIIITILKRKWIYSKFIQCMEENNYSSTANDSSIKKDIVQFSSE